MRVLILTLAVVVLAACSTYSPDVSSRDCKEKVALVEVSITSAQRVFVAALPEMTKDQAVIANRAIKKADALANEAWEICPLDQRKAWDLLITAEAFIDKSNKISGAE